MLTRRTALLGAAALPLARAAGAAVEGVDPPVNDDGLFHQDWFYTSFMDMAEDHADAAAEGKHLMVLIEQRGCPYCRELHRVNLARPEIADYLKENYFVVQLNMWGDKEVTDFDGETLSEKDICRKWFVSFTPTTLLFNARDAGATDLRSAEAFRLPGYFKPFHFISGLEYAASDEYRDTPFQRFLQARFDHLEEQGLNPDLW